MGSKRLFIAVDIDPPTRHAVAQISAALGFFPARGSPRILWLGISEGLDQLRRMHLEIERRLGDRPQAKAVFNPHLTLARVRRPVSRAQIVEIAGFPAAAGPAPIDRVTLYESRLSPKGPTYVALAEARLKEQM